MQKTPASPHGHPTAARASGNCGASEAQSSVSVAFVIGFIKKKPRGQSIPSNCLKDSVKFVASTPWNDMKTRDAFNKAICVGSRTIGTPQFLRAVRHSAFATVFTLIELLVAIAIIAILASMLLPTTRR